MTDTSWIAKKLHHESTPQSGPGRTEPLCAVLTGISDGRTTYDEDEVTCDACRAIGMALDRGKVVEIGLGQA